GGRGDRNASQHGAVCRRPVGVDGGGCCRVGDPAAAGPLELQGRSAVRHVSLQRHHDGLLCLRGLRDVPDRCARLPLYLAVRAQSYPVLLLAALAPGLLVGSTALSVTLANMLQAQENGALVHPMALLSVFPTALAIAAMTLAVPSVVASAIWSWFFCRR